MLRDSEKHNIPSHCNRKTLMKNSMNKYHVAEESAKHTIGENTSRNVATHEVAL